MEWMFMPLKRYADFSGRSRRMEFWMWQLFQVIIHRRACSCSSMGAGRRRLLMTAATRRQLMAVGGVVLHHLYALCDLLALAFFIPELAVDDPAPARYQSHAAGGCCATGAPIFVMIVARS